MIILFGLKPSDDTIEIYELILYFVILLKNVEYIFDCYYYNRLKDCVDVSLNSHSFYNKGQFINIYFIHGLVWSIPNFQDCPIFMTCIL